MHIGKRGRRPVRVIELTQPSPPTRLRGHLQANLGESLYTNTLKLSDYSFLQYLRVFLGTREGASEQNQMSIESEVKLQRRLFWHASSISSSHNRP